jgi:hypothetical protein
MGMDKHRLPLLMELKKLARQMKIKEDNFAAKSREFMETGVEVGVMM